MTKLKTKPTKKSVNQFLNKVENPSKSPIFTLVVVWIIAVYLAFNTLLNAVSKSKQEKLIMTPLSLISAICCFVVAILA